MPPIVWRFTSAICSERVAKLHVQERSAACVLANQTKLLLSLTLAKAVTVGDEITFPIPESDAVGPEILVAKKFVAGRMRYLYQAPIGYVSQPKQDNRGQHFVSAEVQRGKPWHRIDLPALRSPEGVLLPPANLRRARRASHALRRAAYSAMAAPSELRVAFKLRDLELKSMGVPHAERVALERAFNIVGQPELRACYDSLLADA